MNAKQEQKDRIENLKELLETATDEQIKKCLSDKIKDNDLLHSIYMTGGANNNFSQQFKDAAVIEERNICEITSLCYEILRARNLN